MLFVYQESLRLTTGISSAPQVQRVFRPPTPGPLHVSSRPGCHKPTYHDWGRLGMVPPYTHKNGDIEDGFMIGFNTPWIQDLPRSSKIFHLETWLSFFSGRVFSTKVVSQRYPRGVQGRSRNRTKGLIAISHESIPPDPLRKNKTYGSLCYLGQV